jgi:hypothetical protein
MYQEWKGIQEKAGEVNSTKAYITNDEATQLILNGYYTSLHITLNTANTKVCHWTLRDHISKPYKELVKLLFNTP